MAFLIGVIILIIFIIIVYIIAKRKVNNFIMKYFGTTNINNIIEQEKIMDEELPKSLSNMDSIYLDKIKKDFPELNINELKSEAEKVILECFNAFEKKEYVINKIDDIKQNNASYKNIKIHKTVISKYEKSNSISTIYFQTALQYSYKENNNNYRLKQDRITTEYIYVINEEKLEKNIKAIGLNCPNCGAPIKTLNNKVCTYCGSGVLDIVKKSFTINNIENK